MLKPASLRAAITAAVPHLQKNPQSLHIFIEEGSVRATMAGGLSSEIAYTLTATLTDYVGEAAVIFTPVIAWLWTNQPDMLQNPERMRDGFRFEADIIDHQRCDIAIKLQLTERIIVQVSPATQTVESGEQEPLPEPDGLTGPALIATITPRPEPPVDPLGEIVQWQLYIHGLLAQEWRTGG